MIAEQTPNGAFGLPRLASCEHFVWPVQRFRCHCAINGPRENRFVRGNPFAAALGDESNRLARHGSFGWPHAARPAPEQRRVQSKRAIELQAGIAWPSKDAPWKRRLRVRSEVNVGI